MKTLPAILIPSYGVSPLFAEEKPTAQANPICPMHFENGSPAKDCRQEGVVEHGDEVMGFSHEKTTHHFRLYADGDSIEAEANDSEDAASRDEIRSHLAPIATMFAAGNFRAPVFVHAQNPPGTEVMKSSTSSRRPKKAHEFASPRRTRRPCAPAGVPALPDFRAPNRRFA